jgi:hypothetical protein
MEQWRTGEVIRKKYEKNIYLRDPVKGTGDQAKRKHQQHNRDIRNSRVSTVRVASQERNHGHKDRHLSIYQPRVLYTSDDHIYIASPKIVVCQYTSPVCCTHQRDIYCICTLQVPGGNRIM